MIVVDASTVVDAVSDRDRAPEVRTRLREAGTLHAPHVIDVEVASALRRLAVSGELSQDRAADALLDALELPIRHYPHHALVERAWELRARVTIPDGVYIALAEYLGVPLLTSDKRLARSTGHEARVELV